MRNRRLGICGTIVLVAACSMCASAASSDARPAAASSPRTPGERIVAPNDACAAAWLPTFGQTPGTNGNALAFTTFDDGSGHGAALYVGGRFGYAGGVSVANIWSGTALRGARLAPASAGSAVRSSTRLPVRA